MIGNLKQGRAPSITKATPNIPFAKAVHAAAEAPTPTNLLIAAKEIEKIPAIFIHRHELWTAVKRTMTIQRDKGTGTTPGSCSCRERPHKGDWAEGRAAYCLADTPGQGTRIRPCRDSPS